MYIYIYIYIFKQINKYNISFLWNYLNGMSTQTTFSNTVHYFFVKTK